MLILFRVVFHFLCSIGRFFRKIFQVIFGRRHDEYASSISKTEPVTLEHIRIIGEMENDSHRPLQSFTSAPKVNQYLHVHSIVSLSLDSTSRMEYLGCR